VKAFRFHFTSASFMPGILGGMIAWTQMENSTQDISFW